MALNESPASLAPRPLAVFTQGSILRHVLVMIGTSATGLLSIFVVELLTVLYIAQLHDPTLLGALAVAKTLMFLITAVGLGITVAVAALVARCLGANDLQQARQLAGSAVWLVLGAALGSALVQWLLLDIAVGLFGGDTATRAAARSYLAIAIPASVLMAIWQLCAQLLRTAGFSSQAMWITLSATAGVAVIDPLLIFVLGLGLDGAALAYLLSCLFTSSYGLHFVYRRARLAVPVNWAQFRRLGADIRRIAVPAIIGNLATPLGIAYMMATVAHLGPEALAGITVVDRLIQLCFGVLFVLPGALGPILGQNLGAGDGQRVIAAVCTSVWFSLGYGAGVSLALLVAQPWLAVLFKVQGDSRQILEVFCHYGGVLWTLIGLLFLATAIFITMGRSLYVTLFGWLRATLGTVPFVWCGAQLADGPGALLGQLLGNAAVGLAACLVAWRLLKRTLAALPDSAAPGLPVMTGTGQ